MDTFAVETRTPSLLRITISQALISLRESTMRCETYYHPAISSQLHRGRILGHSTSVQESKGAQEQDFRLRYPFAGEFWKSRNVALFRPI